MAIRLSEKLHDLGEFIPQERENAQAVIPDLSGSAGFSNSYPFTIERSIVAYSG